MLKKLLLKQANPLCGWTKLGILLLFPGFIYKHEWWALIVFFVLIVVATVSFPKPKQSQKSNFMYHVFRGMYLELVGEGQHNSELWKMLLGSVSRKIITVTIFVSYFVFSAYLLWEDHLEIGLLLYYIGTLFVLSSLIDYADISKMISINESWDKWFE